MAVYTICLGFPWSCSRIYGLDMAWGMFISSFFSISTLFIILIFYKVSKLGTLTVRIPTDLNLKGVTFSWSPESLKSLDQLIKVLLDSTQVGNLQKIVRIWYFSTFLFKWYHFVAINWISGTVKFCLLKSVLQGKLLVPLLLSWLYWSPQTNNNLSARKSIQ